MTNSAVAMDHLSRDLPEGPVAIVGQGRMGTALARSLRDARTEEHSYSIGGIPKPIYRSRVLKNMMAPTLRADYEMLNRYRCDPSPQISCPVTVLHSDADVLTTLDDASAWNELTVGTYSYEGFTGGHFYLTEQEVLVARLVSELGIGHTAEELRTAVPLQRETSSADRTHTIEPVH